MKNLIAVTMAYNPAESDNIMPGVEYSYIRREYGRAVKQAGGEPLFVDASADPKVIASLVDGVIISGGEDIEPDFYGETDTHCGVKEPRQRTEWERRLIEACDTYEVPILGICYGSQLLNVHYGGTLYQDIARQRGSDLDHGTSAQSAIHNVTFDEPILGYRKSQVMPSTARHHQAVRDLAPGFEAVAYADDGVIEAIKGHGHFGIQWHPESDATAAMIYANFVAHCRSVRRRQPLSQHLPAAEGLPA